MASSNIKLFDENKGNMLTDTEFNISSQRLNGLQTGVASSQLQNKAMYQASLVAYAIAQVMMQNGKNANDTDAVSAFVANLSGTMLQKVYDVATTAEAKAGSATGKWMSPSLVKTFFDNMKATTSEAQSGTNNTKWMSPSLVKTAFNYMKANTSEAQEGTNDTKWMSPALVKSAIDYVFNSLKATTAEAQAGTNDAKWMSPSKTKVFYDSKIAGSIEDSVPIGTVKFSIDNPDSNKYLLCNGASLDSSAYPLLYSKLPGDFTSGWILAKTLSLSGLQYVIGVRIVNGYAVILCLASSKVTYAYGTTLSNLTWVTTNISSSSSGMDIGWDGSKYVIMVAENGAYYYASSLSSKSWTAVNTGLKREVGNVCRFVPDAKRFVVCGVNYGSTNERNTLYVHVYDTKTNNPTATTTFENNGYNGQNPGVVGRYACFINPRYNKGNWFITVDAVSSTISAVKMSINVTDAICAKLDLGLAVFALGGTFYLLDTSGNVIREAETGAGMRNSNGSYITKVDEKYYISSYDGEWFLRTEDFQTFEALKSSYYACGVLKIDNNLHRVDLSRANTVDIYENTKTLPAITVDKVHAYIKARN